MQVSCLKFESMKYLLSFFKDDIHFYKTLVGHYLGQVSQTLQTFLPLTHRLPFPLMVSPERERVSVSRHLTPAQIYRVSELFYYTHTWVIFLKSTDNVLGWWLPYVELVGMGVRLPPRIPNAANFSSNPLTVPSSGTEPVRQILQGLLVWNVVELPTWFINMRMITWCAVYAPN